MRPIASISFDATVQGHGPVGGLIDYGANLRLATCCLANALRKQGVVFAQITAYDEYTLQRGELGNG